LQPLENVVGGILILPATAEVIASFVDMAGEAPEELSAIINIMAAPPMPFVPEEHHGELIVMALVVYAGPIEEGEKVLAPFRALATPIVDMLKPIPYPDMFAGEEEFRPLAVGRTLFLDTVDRDVAKTILDRIRASSALIAATQLRVLGGAIARVPDDATAFAHRKSRIMASVAAIYATQEEERIQQTWVDEGVAALRQSDTGAYVNFVSDEGESGVRAAYPGDTWKRLAEIKRRYDPTNVFRLNQNIPPA
jgi:Berberine and berberine like